ncbi:MAG: NYN domain-containing protein [Defluviitaleaceae bacterium]|nr:NYN domain-containing protein [Defluviitaleaceae bacterium]
MTCNTAIFYDIENLLGLFSGKTNTVLNLDEIYRRVLEVEGVHGVSIQRAYADWALPQHRNLRNSVLQVGIEPVQIFNTNQHDKVKNAADVSLIIDAVDLLAKRPEIENYVVASGDGIFAFLAKKLHEYGKRVIGCSFDRITNIIFRNACDYFIALEKSDSSIIATSSRRKSKSSAALAQPQVAEAQTAPNVAAVSPVVSAPKTIPTSFPKTKYTEALVSADIEIWCDSGDSAGCFHVIRQMIEALFVEETNDLPGLEVSVFTNYVSRYLPDFKVTRHGFKRVGEFMRFIMTGSPYCLHSISNNVLLIAPRKTAKGTIMEDIKGLLITAADGSRYNSVFNVPVGEPFIYSITPPEKQPKVAKPSARRRHVKPETPVVNETAPAKEITVEGSIRKWIKTQFEVLSAEDSVPLSEVRKLTTPEYSLATFGVRTPIFREIETRSNLIEQRTANGKIKYWKESFRFNGRMYLIYKEWVANLHQERFVAWLAAFKM